MKSIRFTPLFVFLIVFSLSCAFVTQSISSGGGPGGFTTEATPYGSVKLSWDAVDGAQGYLLESQLEGLDFFIPVAELNADQTSYEDYLAPEESTLTYRVQATTADKPGGYSTTSVTTLAVQPNPLTVQAEFAEDQVVTQSISAEGGSMSLTDPNGVIYELQVPAGAVLAATDFTLTPISDIQGWPLDGTNLGSVRIGPESLDLYAYLTLTITLPQDLPQDGTTPVGYGFEGSGDEFHLQPITIATAETSALPNGGGIQAMPILFQPKVIVIKQPVKKPGSQGVGTGTKKSLTNFVQQHPPTDAGVNAGQQQVAQQAADDDLPALPILSPQALDALNQKNASNLERQMQKLIDRLIKAEKNKKTDCASAAKAYDESIDLSQQADELSVSSQVSRTLENLRSELYTDIKDVINKGISECEKSKPGKPPKGYGCLQKLMLKLKKSNSGEINSTFNDHAPFSNGELDGFQKTLKYKCGPPAYRADKPGVTSPPVCDFTQQFQLVFEADGVLQNWNFNSGSWDMTADAHLGCVVSYTGGTYEFTISEDAQTVTMSTSSSTGNTCGIASGAVPGQQIIWKADPTAVCDSK